MEHWRLTEHNGARFIEAEAGVRLLHTVDDVSGIIEVCFSLGALSALVRAENLTEKFFDLSSREAGGILGRLRNYRIRLAVVCIPGAVAFSTRFHEMAREESASGYFQLVDSAEAGREWLASQTISAD